MLKADCTAAQHVLVCLKLYHVMLGSLHDSTGMHNGYGVLLLVLTHTTVLSASVICCLPACLLTFCMTPAVGT